MCAVSCISASVHFTHSACACACACVLCVVCLLCAVCNVCILVLTCLCVQERDLDRHKIDICVLFDNNVLFVVSTHT